MRDTDSPETVESLRPRLTQQISAPPHAEWEFERVSSCLVCGSDRSETIYDKPIRSIDLKYVKCSNCGLVYQNPRLTRAALGKYFSSSTFIRDSESGKKGVDEPLGYVDYFSLDASYKKTARFRLAHIARFKRPPAKLLEIGTATGSFLDEARTAGYGVRGVDVSETFAEIARGRYGVQIDTGFIEEVPLPSAHYDVVCAFGGVSCWSDPVKGFRNIRRTLKPDGILVLNHPNIDGPTRRLLGDRYPEFNHAACTVFSNRTIAACLGRAGFRVVLRQTERQIASFGRIAAYFRMGTGHELLKKLGVSSFSIPVLAFGTTFAICVPADTGAAESP